MILCEITQCIRTDSLIHQIRHDKTVFCQHSKTVDHSFVGNTQYFAELEGSEFFAAVLLQQQEKQFLFFSFQVGKAGGNIFLSTAALQLTYFGGV